MAAADKSVITCDMEGIIETFSSGAEAMFGYNAQEVVSRQRVSLFSPGEIVLQNLNTWLTSAVKDGEYVTDTVFIRKNGDEFGARIRISPTFKGGVQIGYCGVTEELSEVVDVPIKTATKIIRWLVITRAPFLTAALTPTFIGLAYSSGVVGIPIVWTHAILAILGVAFLHLASNVFNDYFDVKNGTDAANSKYFVQYSGGSRAIEMRLIDLKGTRNVAIGLAIAALVIGVYLTSVVGTGVLVIGTIGLFLGFFYTAPPIRLVARHGLGEIVIGLAFGPLITMGMHYVLTSAYSWEAFLFGIPAGLLTTNILVLNQVPDEEGDASTGKNHLIVTFGKKSAILFYSMFWMLSIAVTVWLGLMYGKPLLNISALVSLMYGAWIISYMRKHILLRTLVKANVNTIKLQIVATVLFALALVVTW
ncbi:MAG: UbiA family prenyltransferase [Ignavibacteria bacterium]|nr:UbiA family prenyltransferase [Ignavibacteria bacterium]